MAELLKSSGAADVPDEKGIIAVRQWEYTVGMDTDRARLALDEIFDFELPFFEVELRHWLNDHSYRIRPFPELMEPDHLEDGKEISVRATRFERNGKARRKCIAHYGTACQICGFDFGSVYGEDFAGKIEVHHIVPLSEIREEYVVDPVRDLIPVCSNCHTALHSRKDGYYTPDELRQLLARKGNG
ncbi:MAG: HNH endonuclease [Clostridia bacterium]|nr:HNH endonuclease [Clostridia bacterium]